MSDERPSTSLNELDAKLQAARAHRRATEPKDDEGDTRAGSGLALGMRVGLEFVSAIGVGVVIGLLLDYWLETKPWFLVGFLLLGSVAGVLNVFGVMGGVGYAAGYGSTKKDSTKKGSGSE